MNAGVLQVVSILHDRPLFKYILTHIYTCPGCISGTTFDHLWEATVIPELCENTTTLNWSWERCGALNVVLCFSMQSSALSFVDPIGCLLYISWPCYTSVQLFFPELGSVICRFGRCGSWSFSPPSSWQDFSPSHQNERTEHCCPVYGVSCGSQGRLCCFISASGEPWIWSCLPKKSKRRWGVNNGKRTDPEIYLLQIQLSPRPRGLVAYLNLVVS